MYFLKILNYANNCVVNNSTKSLIFENDTQWAFTCSKLTIETLEQDVKYVQS